MGERAPEYVVERVREALARDPRVGELELDVSIDGGTIVVEGIVPTEERRESIPDVVRRSAPDHEVENRTTVTPMRPADAAEEVT